MTKKNPDLVWANALYMHNLNWSNRECDYRWDAITEDEDCWGERRVSFLRFCPGDVSTFDLQLRKTSGFWITYEQFTNAYVAELNREKDNYSWGVIAMNEDEDRWGRTRRLWMSSIVARGLEVSTPCVSIIVPSRKSNFHLLRYVHYF